MKLTNGEPQIALPNPDRSTCADDLGVMIDPGILALFAPPEAEPLEQTAFLWLLRQGASVEAVAAPWAVRMGRVAFQPNGTYVPAPGVGDFAFIFGILDIDIVDAVAFAPSTGRAATRLRIGSMLGQGQIGRDALGSTGRAIPVWRNPIAWLRAGRIGVVIVHPDRAAHHLAGLCLLAEDERHRRQLRRSLRVLRPQIDVARLDGDSLDH